MDCKSERSGIAMVNKLKITVTMEIDWEHNHANVQNAIAFYEDLSIEELVEYPFHNQEVTVEEMK